MREIIEEEASVSSESSTHEEEEVKKKEVLAKKETAAVARSKVLVYLALMLAATGVACAIYFVLSADEEKELKTQVS